jgi:hypothetical protein
MEHFDIARWADYVHGFVSEPEREMMECHLLGGCGPCRRVSELIIRIQREKIDEPPVPEELVNSAKAIFRTAYVEPDYSRWMTLPHLAVQLINYGSRPALAGARSAGVAEVHKLYRAGAYSIGLQTERDPESGEVAVVGQLTDRTQSDRPLSGVAVVLTVRDRIIASAVTNSFGEFCLVGRPLEGLSVRLRLENEQRQVVLPVAGASGSGGNIRQIFRHLMIAVLLLLCLSCPTLASPYILTLQAGADITSVAVQYGLMVIRPLQHYGGTVYLVNVPDPVSPQFIRRVIASPLVRQLEADGSVQPSETPAPIPASPVLDASTLSTAVQSNAPVLYYGSQVRGGYAQQWATSLIELPGALASYASGRGTVAVIDTGVDPNHPALKNALVPGYDFTTEQAGTASEFSGLNQTTAAILNQSSSATLDAKQFAMILNQDTVAILDQDTVAILDASKLPLDFGHGTMVAGLIHLIAPTAQIMPLKAFNSDGSANLSDIVQAIYYAVDNHANIINMSFSSLTDSPSVSAAMQYAVSHNVICVASGGNEGKEEMVVYPAGDKGVIGVGSTNAKDQRSSFSNFETPAIDVFAPGEALVTTYPGNNYAMVWGTSFSTALTSGAAALLTQLNPQITPQQVSDALKHGHRVHDIGTRLDILVMILYALFG